MGVCKHCGEEFDLSDKPKQFMANHSRWCTENSKRKEYVKKLKHARAAKTKESLIKAGESIKEAHKRGAYANVEHGKSFRGKKHKPETIEVIRQKALASKHRRLRKGTVMYKGVLLDSSWELELAKRLDAIGIVWERPKPLPWTDSKGKKHNYFPDFYLPELDLYLDPKNPHAFRVQKKKIDILNETYSNIIWITSLEECQQYIPQ